MASRAEVRADVCKVKIHSVMPRGLVDALNVADALCFNQGTDRSTPHAQSAAARVGPLGLEFAVADDIRAHLAIEGRSGGFGQLRQNARWVQKDLSNDSPIDMHFLKMLAVDLDVDHDRRHCARYAGGSDHDVPKELKSARRLTGCYGAHIPCDRTPGIQIGRSNLQDAPVPALLGDLGQEF